MEIQFKVNNQTVKRIGENKPANHSQEFLKLKFDFMTTDWQGLTKFALFKNIEGTAYRVALTDDTVIVPNAVLQNDRFLFSVYGVNNEDVRATTNLTQIYINESGYTRDVENDIPSDDPTIVEQIYLDIATAKSEAESNAKDYTDMGLAGKSDLGHKHTKSDITDLPTVATTGKYDDLTGIPVAFPPELHEHYKSEITDFNHTHDDRYYTETEVNTIIENLKHDLLNRCNFTSDKQIIQTSEIADITAYLLDDGMPKANTTIYFYEKEDN